MSPYRKQIEKLYNRIYKIVSSGPSYLQNYYDLIDECIDNGQSELLQDTMYNKFKIDTTIFSDIDSLKKNTFKKIAFQTQNKTNVSLKDLYNSKGVYTVGTHFFDLMTSQYLGDIKSSQSSNNVDALEVYTFYPPFMRSSIPPFNTSPRIVLEYKVDQIYYYNDRLYKCSKGYIWNKENQITPTYSNYWAEIVSGSQSLHIIDSPNLNLTERYSRSIDLLRNYTYTDYSSNKYIVSNYIDEYFE